MTSPATDPGRTAYEARFADHGPRDFDPWDSLTPEVKAIWARVEAACRPQSSASVAVTDDDQALRKALTFACNDPGHFVGFKGERSLGEWQADAIMRGPLADFIAAEARTGSDYADAMDARMADAMHMGTLLVALTVLAECRISSGLHYVRKWFADGATGPIPWPDGTMFAAWAAEHDIYDCNGAMGFRRGDRGRAA